MSFVEDLVSVLSSYHGGYRLMRRRIRGYRDYRIPQSVLETPTASVRVVLSRLKKRGLVQNENGLWRITQKGRIYLSTKLFSIRHTQKRDSVRKSKNMIIAFDIPERKRRGRNWLRVELKNLGFEILQKSVWFGPSPLPKEFITSLKELRILKFVKFFKAEEWEVVHSE